MNYLNPDLLDQLNQKHPLLALAREIPWDYLEDEFTPLYATGGRPAKGVRLMSGLMILKQMHELSDKEVISLWVENPYWQVFCGMKEFQFEVPCHHSDLTYFRKRIKKQGVEKLFAVSVALFGKKARAEKVIIDSTVQEKHITYPTDSKIRIKIINRLLKLGKVHGVPFRRTYAKEIKQLRLDLRFFRHLKKRTKAKKATKRLKTIAGILIRELTKKLPRDVLANLTEDFALFEKILKQKRTTKNKIYSLHEPQAYCIAKGKDHKPYEYGSKVSVVTTFKDNIIVGVVNHDENMNDSKTLDSVLAHVKQIQKDYQPETALCDRGYRGVSNAQGVKIMIPKAPLKRDSRYQRRKKSAYFRRRAAIEPVIGHLKNRFGLTKNKLKGTLGDEINALMAGCAFNMKKWMNQYILFYFFRILDFFRSQKEIHLRILPAG